MTFPRFKKQVNPNKNKHTLRRLERCSSRHLNTPRCQDKQAKSTSAKKEQVTLSPRDISNILIDISMRELYNDGDKRELKLVEEILSPNNIQFTDEKSLESYWDIITNSGYIKPSIGFGNNGKVTLSKAGFDLMSKFGGFKEFLMAQQAISTVAGNNNSDLQAPPSGDDNNQSEDTSTETYYDEE